MTKRLSDMTPEQAARHREKQRQYRERTRDEAYRQREAERHKQRYAEDAEYRARKNKGANDAHMRRRYGFDTAGREQFIAAAGAVCEICRTDKPGGKGFHVDHCHGSGKVRGVLCTGCNVFLGRIEKNPGLLEKMLAYMEKHRG